MFLIFFLLKRPGKGDRRAYEVRLKKKRGGGVTFNFFGVCIKSYKNSDQLGRERRDIRRFQIVSFVFKVVCRGKSEFQLNSSVACFLGFCRPSAFLLLRQRAFCSKKEKGPFSQRHNMKKNFTNLGRNSAPPCMNKT